MRLLRHFPALEQYMVTLATSARDLQHFGKAGLVAIPISLSEAHNTTHDYAIRQYIYLTDPLSHARVYQYCAPEGAFLLLVLPGVCDHNCSYPDDNNLVQALQCDYWSNVQIKSILYQTSQIDR